MDETEELIRLCHLGATESGRPLHASLGFEPIAALSGWLRAALDVGP